MLSVSFSLVLIAAMLFGIVLPGHHEEVDKFNGQTRGPIPAGHNYVVSELREINVAKEYSHPKEVKIGFGSSTCDLDCLCDPKFCRTVSAERMADFGQRQRPSERQR